MSITEEQLDAALKAEEARTKVLQAYTDIFNTPNGQLVLKDLRNQFFERLTISPEGEFSTIVLAAKHDVVTYILAAIEEGEHATRGTTEPERLDSEDVFR